MQTYMDKVKEIIKLFNAIKIERIPWEQNSMADALTRLATRAAIKSFSLVPVEYLWQHNITKKEIMKINEGNIGRSWMDDICTYLQKGELPLDNLEANKLKYKATRYVLLDDTLC